MIMDYMLDKIIQNLKGINFEGPAMFVIVLLALMALSDTILNG